MDRAASGAVPPASICICSIVLDLLTLFPGCPRKWHTAGNCCDGRRRPSATARTAVCAYHGRRGANTVGGLAAGASIGREGPTVLIGASIMHAFYGRGPLQGEQQRRTLILAGGAAG